MAFGKSENASGNRLRAARLAAGRAKQPSAADRELMAIPKANWVAAKRSEKLVTQRCNRCDNRDVTFIAVSDGAKGQI